MSRLPMAKRREQLVNAALAVASRDGVEAATVRAVAAEAGVSLGVVHYCFQDKNELLRAMGEAITARNVERVEFGSPPLDARAAVGNAVTAIWDSMSARRGDQLLAFEMTLSALRNPELAPVATAQLEHERRLAEDLLVEAAAAAGTDWGVPPRHLARTCVAVLDGVALAWLVDGDDRAARADLAQFADHLAQLARPGVQTA
ncbi:TetR/AcrR family transcriptional regulator [Cellulomonas fimi]|uniref:TetR family transcriptional regulator n=1 Tax=Cellulomonas fimi TaxID=1708 RepID=A0A7Y0QHW9_CELFI|nr:TetR family transcriptional regulator [Cellulomonas fimi]NMR20324.1 TetR family transcriptional regulator [Cellulomonas fimi]